MCVSVCVCVSVCECVWFQSWSLPIYDDGDAVGFLGRRCGSRSCTSDIAAVRRPPSAVAQRWLRAPERSLVRGAEEIAAQYH